MRHKLQFFVSLITLLLFTTNLLATDEIMKKNWISSSAAYPSYEEAQASYPGFTFKTLPNGLLVAEATNTDFDEYFGFTEEMNNLKINAINTIRDDVIIYGVAALCAFGTVSIIGTIPTAIVCGSMVAVKAYSDIGDVKLVYDLTKTFYDHRIATSSMIVLTNVGDSGTINPGEKHAPVILLRSQDTKTIDLKINMYYKAEYMVNNTPYPTYFDETINLGSFDIEKGKGYIIIPPFLLSFVDYEKTLNTTYDLTKTVTLEVEDAWAENSVYSLDDTNSQIFTDYIYTFNNGKLYLDASPSKSPDTAITEYEWTNILGTIIATGKTPMIDFNSLIFDDNGLTKITLKTKSLTGKTGSHTSFIQLQCDNGTYLNNDGSCYTLEELCVQDGDIWINAEFGGSESKCISKEEQCIVGGKTWINNQCIEPKKLCDLPTIIQKPITVYDLYDMATDSQGNKYIVASEEKLLFKIDQNNKVTHLAENIGGSYYGNSFYMSVSLDSNNNIYISLYNRIIVYNNKGVIINEFENENLTNTKGIDIDAQNRIWVLNGDSSVNVFDTNGMILKSWNHDLYRPDRILVTPDNMVYVMSYANRLIKYDENGVLQKEYSLNWSLGSIADFTVDDSGNIYILSGQYNKIAKYDSLGNETVIWNIAKFPANNAIHWDMVSKTLLITDTIGQQLHQINPDNGSILMSIDISNAPRDLYNPISLVFDDQKNIYVASRSLGFVGKNFPNQDGKAIIYDPDLLIDDLALDNQNNLYVLSEVSGIYIYSNEGVHKDTFWFSSYGIGRSFGFFLDKKNEIIYIADSDNYKIWKISLDGILLSTWNTLGDQINVSNVPLDIVTDSEGNIYVAGFGGVQMFNSNGEFIKQWDINFVDSITVDDKNNIYVSGYGKLYRLTPYGAEILLKDTQECSMNNVPPYTGKISYNDNSILIPEQTMSHTIYKYRLNSSYVSPAIINYLLN